MILNKAPLARIERECLPCRRTIKRWKLWSFYAVVLFHSSGLKMSMRINLMAAYSIRYWHIIQNVLLFELHYVGGASWAH